MNPGQLNKRITLQQKTTAGDGAGGVTETWSDVATVWAAVEPLNGPERYQAQKLQTIITHKVTIRYRVGVSPKMRVVYSGRILEIVEVIDPNERHEQLRLLCEERNA